MSKQRPIEGARLELGGRSVLGFSGIGLPGGESIFFPEISGYGKHLSIYFPTPGQIATHITHQYPLGRKLRTRRRKTDLGKLMRKIMHSIAPADDPPPHASFFGETGRGEWRAWLGRTLPKIARKPTDCQIWGLRGAMKDLFDRAMPSGGIAGPWVLPLDGVMELARRPRLEFEEMFVPMREEDLSMGGIRMGLSNDFTKAVILMEDERVIELRLEHAENIKEAVFRGLGVADFIDVFWKSEDGRRFGAEIRQLARNGRSS